MEDFRKTCINLPLEMADQIADIMYYILYRDDPDRCHANGPCVRYVSVARASGDQAWRGKSF